MEPTLFSLEDHPQLRSYELLRDALLDKSDKVYVFTRGNFEYKVHREDDATLELHTQYHVEPSDINIGPWGYVKITHSGTGSFDQSVLHSYLVFPPGDNLYEPTPFRIGEEHLDLEEALDYLEDVLIETGDNSSYDDTHACDIRLGGVKHTKAIE